MKTPIEKAISDLIEYLASEYSEEIYVWADITEAEKSAVLADASDLARRVLGEEVPVKQITSRPIKASANLQDWMHDYYNQCRRDIGLEDL